MGYFVVDFIQALLSFIPSIFLLFHPDILIKIIQPSMFGLGYFFIVLVSIMLGFRKVSEKIIELVIPSLSDDPIISFLFKLFIFIFWVSLALILFKPFISYFCYKSYNEISSYVEQILDIKYEKKAEVLEAGKDMSSQLYDLFSGYAFSILSLS